MAWVAWIDLHIQSRVNNEILFCTSEFCLLSVTSLYIWSVYLLEMTMMHVCSAFPPVSVSIAELSGVLFVCFFLFFFLSPDCALRHAFPASIFALLCDLQPQQPSTIVPTVNAQQQESSSPRGSGSAEYSLIKPNEIKQIKGYSFVTTGLCDRDSPLSASSVPVPLSWLLTAPLHQLRHLSFINKSPEATLTFTTSLIFNT